MLRPPPVPRIPRPVPRRFPPTKSMTIALGILASDGLVLAADTQETIQGYAKFTHGKMGASLVSGLGKPENRRACMIAGAGSSPHLHALTALLQRRFTAKPTVSSVDEAESVFAEIIQTFHADHILPYAQYPSIERPEVSMLIGVLQPSSGSKLLVSRNNLLQDAKPYEAVGVGEILAKTFLERFYQLPLLDVWKTIPLAAYIMYLVKSSVDGCGGETDMMCLRHGSHPNFVHMRRQETKGLEQLFGDYCCGTEPTALRTLIGAEPPNRAISASTIRKKLTKQMEQIKKSRSSS